ncbi:MAG: hypothetical protein QOH12_3692 [Solirubrobacteraceae bacterium]|jgi:AcrR family transcriptional regulator|nr:hypothetical protein [Solirubrobacteraceae bacterium]
MSSSSIESERPQRADAKRNRERILESARDAFAVHGPDTQMDEVARLAGVGVGTVYRHFPTKESLLGELVRQQMERMVDNTRAGLARDGEPFAVFADVLRENAGIASGNAAIQYAMLGAGEGVWEYAGVAQAELIGLTEEMITRAQRAATMRADVTAMDIPMLMCGVCATMTHTKPHFDWRRHLELIIDALRAP